MGRDRPLPHQRIADAVRPAAERWNRRLRAEGILLKCRVATVTAMQE